MELWHFYGKIKSPILEKQLLLGWLLCYEPPIIIWVTYFENVHVKKNAVKYLVMNRLDTNFSTDKLQLLRDLSK